ncbi:CU044_2847 family protein [Streptomyces sp. SS]|uniref:CU044_2847 family protein n=1 Tax=Streptomyces sp. SS TaxID=260742 RepID=UPI000305DB24|nr:CU044_2847 family protein [Streptomyces sp. SS]
MGEAVREPPGTLQASLEPVTEVAHATLQQLHKARPDVITVEFGVDLAFEVGAVITKSRAEGHLKVTVPWQREAFERPSPTDESGG